jgi:protein SCO1/2
VITLPRSFVILFAATTLLASGCRQAPAPTASAGPVHHYPIQGKVVGTNAETGQVEVDAGAIPGFMDAMTMPYQLKNASDIKTIHQGDDITGTLDVGGDGTFLDDVKVSSRTQERRDPTPQVLMKPLVPGEAVPDFTLTNEDGKQIRLSDFHGKVLLMTFIYTHCPLTDYCPRMSRNFATIDKTLEQFPSMYDKTHLLSVSFDPKRDTPAVLRSYGGAYTGKYTNETFDHWSFAVPLESDIDPLFKFFDVSSVPAPGGTLTHTLSTVVIGPDGKIAAWYTGNDWTVPQVLAEIQKETGARS